MEGETVMMSIAKGKYYGLREVANEIWNGLREPTPVRDLCSGLQAAFDVTPDQCEREVLQFLNELHDEGLVSVHA